MKTKKLIVAILAFFGLATSVCAQIEGQEERIQRRAAEKVGQMNDYIKNMADYNSFFRRDNFLASLKAAKERKMKWEKEVQQKWEELNIEMGKDTVALTAR